jgi:hypothetical protein
VSRSGPLGDWAIVLFVVGWVLAIVFLVGSMSTKEGTTATATSEPPALPSGPAPELPTEITVGSELDPQTGLVVSPQQDLDRSAQLSFSLWLGEPVGVPAVRLSFAQLTADGFVPIAASREVGTEPVAEVVSGSMPAAEIMDTFGAGTYALILTRGEDDRLGTGAVQLGTTAPERVDSFPAWRPITIPAGERSGHRFDPSGEILDTRTASSETDVEGNSNHRAVWDGVPYLYVTDGDWAGYWLAEPGDIHLAQ